MNKELDRYKGALLGLAIGDALGTTLEFSPKDSFTPIKDIIGGGPFKLKAGQWTDDTSMALCMAESLIENESFDAMDQMDKYVDWMRNGYFSSNGRCFDIGGTTYQALNEYTQTGQPFSGDDDPFSAGNGSIMRLAPTPMAFANYPKEAIIKSGSSSKTTHAATEAIHACWFMGSLLIGALKGVSKEELLFNNYCVVPEYWNENSLSKNIKDIASGQYKNKTRDEIFATGYTVKTLEAALWAFYNTNSFEEGALLAVNLGNDADTVGAVYGQIAGAYYGMSGIPNKWINIVHQGLLIETMAEQLYQLAQSINKKSK